jgi:leucyl/phenylalanyl-tRNA--protein transferase
VPQYGRAAQWARQSAVPVEPPPSRWDFPPVDTADDSGVVGIGADLEPGTLLHAYRHGLFPMPLFSGGPLAWWSPDPRGVLPLDGLRVSRSLRQSMKHYEIRVDTAFGEVVDACRDPARDGAWITPEIKAAYTRLHDLGFAHSVEAWTRPGDPTGDPVDGPSLAGGLYGIAVGGLFAGESMFHHGRDGSKVALVHLVERLVGAGATVLDVQWTTPHLRSLGAIDLPRYDYVARAADAVLADIDPFAA